MQDVLAPDGLLARRLSAADTDTLQYSLLHSAFSEGRELWFESESRYSCSGPRAVLQKPMPTRKIIRLSGRRTFSCRLTFSTEAHPLPTNSGTNSSHLDKVHQEKIAHLRRVFIGTRPRRQRQAAERGRQRQQLFAVGRIARIRAASRRTKAGTHSRELGGLPPLQRFHGLRGSRRIPGCLRGGRGRGFLQGAGLRLLQLEAELVHLGKLEGRSCGRGGGQRTDLVQNLRHLKEILQTVVLVTSEENRSCWRDQAAVLSLISPEWEQDITVVSLSNMVLA